MVGNSSSDKATLRREAELRRRALSPEVVERWGGEVQKHLAALPLFSDRVIRAVGVYDAQPFEVPLADFILELTNRGVVCVYPRVVRGEKTLRFHEVGETWARGPFGLREPPTYAPERALADIDVFLVPGVAFTADGRRLGRGGGYYDTTLSLANAQAARIGISFANGVLDDLPVEAHDQRVDFVATELGVLATHAGR